ncbi:hypothetical protein [Rummeliibacillus pycnus]|uniref:hypothetical protein n=1 Tax=Rummeliibacillus pycnus TaxID=101070 RepID=UPI0037C81FDC
MNAKYKLNKSISPSFKISKYNNQKLAKFKFQKEKFTNYLEKKYAMQRNTLETPAIRSIRRHDRLINNILGSTNKQMEKLHATEKQLNYAQSTVGLASMQTESLRAIEDKWKIGQRATGLAGMNTESLRAIEDKWHFEKSAAGLASKQIDAMRVIQNHWSGSFKTLLVDLDDKSEAYRTMQYELLSKAQENQWFLDEELVDICLEDKIDEEDTAF